MLSVKTQEFNSSRNSILTHILENWQMNCLRNYGNTIINRRHLDKKLSEIYYYLYGTKIRYNVLNKESYLEKYNECFEALRSHLEFLLNKSVSFRFSPSVYGWDADCYIIETKNKTQEVF